MDPVNQQLFSQLVQVQRQSFGLDNPIATCPECRCDLYEDAEPCGETGCPVVPVESGRAAA